MKNEVIHGYIWKNCSMWSPHCSYPPLNPWYVVKPWFLFLFDIQQYKNSQSHCSTNNFSYTRWSVIKNILMILIAFKMVSMRGERVGSIKIVDLWKLNEQQRKWLIHERRLFSSSSYEIYWELVVLRCDCLGFFLPLLQYFVNWLWDRETMF